jgi:flagellin-like hook-associated protein FlgL
MRELAVQAASETYSSIERSYLNEEFIAMTLQITNTARQANMNDVALLSVRGVDVGFVVDTSSSMGSQIADLQTALNDFRSRFIDAGLDVDFGLAEINRHASRDPIDSTVLLAQMGDASFETELNGITLAGSLIDPYAALVNAGGTNDFTGSTDPDAFSPRESALEKHLILLTDTSREIDVIPGSETAADIGAELAADGWIVNSITNSTTPYSDITSATGGEQHALADIDAALQAIGDTIEARLGAQVSGDINVQVGVHNDSSSLINIKLPEDYTAVSLGVQGVEIDTLENAREAIDAVDAAIDFVNAGRSDIGASTRRLELTHGLQTARLQTDEGAASKIRDIDMAVGTSELTRAQIVSNFAVAVATQLRSIDRKAMEMMFLTRGG